MTQSTLGAILLVLIFCVWPLLVHAAIVWITRRDWSSSGEIFSHVISNLFHKENEE
jgi:hypothetical protein